MGEFARLEVCFATQEELVSAFEADWKHGRAFLFEVDGECNVPCDCELVILHPNGDDFSLMARAVAWVPQGDRMGLGVEFLEWDEGLAEALGIFVAEVEGTNPDIHAGDGDFMKSKEAQLLEMSIPQQVKLARTANQEERVILERRLGKTVWETLLKNPKITVPEVARMARKGTMPRPLIDIIIDNQTWMKNGPVQRALLGNPRLSWDQVQKVLKALPKADLKQVAKNNAYPASVRDAARKLDIG